MKIKKIILLSKYKKIKKDTKIKFNDENLNVITGINGSGKSIILEIIALVFFLIKYSTKRKKIPKNLNIKFILEYEIFDIQLGKNVNVKITNRNGNFEIESEKEKRDLKYVLKFLFPKKIVTYSSGNNENLSTIYYLDTLFTVYNKKILNNLEEEENILFLNERERKLLLITIYIFFSGTVIQELKKIIGIYEIKEIKFNIDLSKKNNQSIELYNEIENFLEKFCKLEDNKYVIRAKEIRKIKENFLNPLYFFELLRKIESINLYDMSKIELRKLINGDIITLKEKIQKRITDRKFFVDSIKFNNNISYKNISDGEMQLLEVLSIIKLYNDNLEEILILLDEPETHLNIQWKVKYTYFLKKINNKNSKLIFLTTHNAEVLSDLKKEEVIFVKNAQIQNVNFNTFGLDHSIINNKFFSIDQNISFNALIEYDSLINEIEKLDSLENKINEKVFETQKKEILSKLAESPERMFLLFQLYKKRSSNVV